MPLIKACYFMSCAYGWAIIANFCVLTKQDRIVVAVCAFSNYDDINWYWFFCTCVRVFCSLGCNACEKDVIFLGLRLLLDRLSFIDS